MSFEMKAHLEKAENGWIIVVYSMDKKSKGEYTKRFIAQDYDEVKEILKQEVK